MDPETGSTAASPDFGVDGFGGVDEEVDGAAESRRMAWSAEEAAEMLCSWAGD